MSKSLGNVLDPFEVMDHFGADALRFYCFREVRFGQDGSVSTDGFETRYETELANELRQPGQPHARDDRPLPRRRRARGRARPGAGRRLRRARRARSRELLDRAEITQALERDLAARAAAQPLRRGARAVAARQGRGARRRARPSRCARSPRACASSTVLLHPYMPETAAKLLAALGARRGPGARRRARSARGPEAGASRSSRRCSRRSQRPQRDRLAHPPRPRACRRRPSWSRRRARRASGGS